MRAIFLWTLVVLASGASFDLEDPRSKLTQELARSDRIIMRGHLAAADGDDQKLVRDFSFQVSTAKAYMKDLQSDDALSRQLTREMLDQYDRSLEALAGMINRNEMAKLKRSDPMRPPALTNTKLICSDNAVLSALSVLRCFDRAVRDLHIESPLKEPLTRFIEGRDTQATMTVDIDEFTEEFRIREGKEHGKDPYKVLGKLLRNLPVLTEQAQIGGQVYSGEILPFLVQATFPRESTDLHSILDFEPVSTFTSSALKTSLQYNKILLYPYSVFIVTFDKGEQASIKVDCPRILVRYDPENVLRRFTLKAVVALPTNTHAIARVLAKNGRWYQIDDYTVTEIPFHQVVDNKVIMAFYEDPTA